MNYCITKSSFVIFMIMTLVQYAMSFIAPFYQPNWCIRRHLTSIRPKIAHTGSFHDNSLSTFNTEHSKLIDRISYKYITDKIERSAHSLPKSTISDLYIGQKLRGKITAIKKYLNMSLFLILNVCNVLYIGMVCTWMSDVKRSVWFMLKTFPMYTLPIITKICFPRALKSTSGSSSLPFPRVEWDCRCFLFMTRTNLVC
jgi:hypothetical protein